MTRDRTVDIMADIVARLVAGPRSVADLATLTGYGRDTIYTHLNALRAEGLAEPDSELRKGRQSPRWFWMGRRA